MDEFEVIETYFSRQPVHRDDVLLGIGDDAAVLSPPPGSNLVCTTDLLLEDVHFARGTSPHSIGHKALAVSLSDLAAMGARPAWATMTLALGAASPKWLQDFCSGFFELAGRFDVQLVGGDLTRGPVAVGVQLTGYAGEQGYLTRSGARQGDDIYVSGCLGDAALGVQVQRGDLVLGEAETDAVIRRLEYPEPRVELGSALCGLATAAVDISDGLYADLGHIAAASSVAAWVEVERLPLSAVYRRQLDVMGWDHAMGFGDDYELCFTAAPASRVEIDALAAGQGLSVTRVGAIDEGEGVRVHSESGEIKLHRRGYNHFRAD